jgi:hypothetical protein
MESGSLRGGSALKFEKNQRFFFLLLLLPFLDFSLSARLRYPNSFYPKKLR